MSRQAPCSHERRVLVQSCVGVEPTRVAPSVICRGCGALFYDGNWGPPVSEYVDKQGTFTAPERGRSFPNGAALIVLRRYRIAEVDE